MIEEMDGIVVGIEWPDLNIVRPSSTSPGIKDNMDGTRIRNRAVKRS